MQYLTNKFRYEVLDVTWGLLKQQILVSCFKLVWLKMSGHAQSDDK